MSSPKFCAECGNTLKADVKFCSNCGAKTEAAAGTSAESAAPEPNTPAPDAAAPTPEAASPVAEKPAPAPESAAPAADKSVTAAEKSSEKAEKAQAAVKSAAQAAASAEKAADSAFMDPVAAMLASDDDDDDDDHLSMPDGETSKTSDGLPLGLISLGLLAAIIVGGGGFIASDDELSARFQCNVLGRKAMCVTEADKLYEIEKKEKQEELELMQHHYGDFDLNFTPEKDVTFTLKQTRYEETRGDFVKRVREGADDKRVRKTEKVGEYSEKKGQEGEIKGVVAFKETAQPPTFKPAEGKNLVLPLTLTDLPLVEREQVEASNPEKRLSAEDVKKLEQKRANPEVDADGKVINDKQLKVKTVALSSWIYEIELTAPGYEPRSVLFYEAPLPPDLDAKKLEADGMTLRAFKRRPDGKFVIANASFDMLPKPETIRTRYIQLLKELHCLRKSKEYEGRNEQGKAVAEDLIWEQKAFSKVLREIAEKNEGMEDWEEYKKKEFTGYQCPKAVVDQAR